MKILILEDNAERQREFRTNLKNHDIVIVDSSKDTISKLINGQYNLLFLDHDLGGQVYVPSGENTGFEVAEFLEKHPQLIPTNIIVHSLNVVGAQNIIRALPQAVHIPFAWTKSNLAKMGLI